MLRIIILISFIVSAFCANAFEQLKPIKMYAEVLSESEVQIKFDITNGWYVYSNVNSDLGLPLQIKINNLDESEYSILWPIPSVKKENILEDEFRISVYDKNFVVPIKILSDVNEIDISVSLGACEKICVTQNENFKLTLNSADAKESYLLLLFFAFIGGLILNVMPCVLPVLALKLFNIIKYSGYKESHVKAHLLSTTFGIISSFWVIAFITIFLRSLGAKFGWGFQFQNPQFLIFLIVVLMTFFIVLIKDIEIHLPYFISNKLSANSKGLFGSFGAGAFATLLATPCTAPFLSASVAFALTSSFSTILLFYTFMGLGMALPYYGIALHPSFIRLIPKPGKWMLKVKRVFAILILLTAVWLINVLIVNVFVDTKMSNISHEGWEVFSEEKVEKYINEGYIVLVDITAEWCILCKANKALVLNQQGVVDFLKENNVKKLRADFTNRSEDIAKFLESNKRYGIPFNIIYSRQFKSGIILPEILNKKIVVDEINRSKHP